MNNERRAMLLMLAFAALWALVEALAARVLTHYSPYQVVWTRYGVHLAFMISVWGWREPATLWRTRRPVYQLARSLLMLGMPACWIISVQNGVDPGTLMSIFWLSPLIIVTLARVFLDEQISAWSWLASAGASIGAILVNGLGRPPAVEWLIFPLGMALCFSSYVVMTRPLRREPTRANLFYTALGVFVALAPAMPALWVMPNAHDFAVLVGVGLFGYAGLYALDRMAALAPLSISAPIAAMQLVATAALGFGLGHYLLNLESLVGLLLIGAVALFVWAKASGLAQPPILEDAA